MKRTRGEKQEIRRREEEEGNRIGGDMIKRRVRFEDKGGEDREMKGRE